jgi:hypothetical protein
MSTEHQKYSTENQAAAIAEYADLHGMRIVKTYEDSGKSGLISKDAGDCKHFCGMSSSLPPVSRRF